VIARDLLVGFMYQVRKRFLVNVKEFSPFFLGWWKESAR
jgi:hypothetical protein